MGNKLTDSNVNQTQSHDLFKKLKKNLQLTMSNEEKINLILKNKSNKMSDDFINQVGELKIKKIQMNKYILLETGSKLLTNIINTTLTNDMNITLAQASLVPDVNVINPSVSEDYFRVVQSNFLASLNQFKTKEQDCLYNFFTNKNRNQTENTEPTDKPTTGNEEVIEQQINLKESGNNYNNSNYTTSINKKLNKSFDDYKKNFNKTTSPGNSGKAANRTKKSTEESFQRTALRTSIHSKNSSTNNGGVMNKNISNKTISKQQVNSAKDEEKPSIYSSFVSNVKVSKYLEEFSTQKFNYRISEVDSKNENETQKEKTILKNSPNSNYNYNADTGSGFKTVKNIGITIKTKPSDSSFTKPKAVNNYSRSNSNTPRKNPKANKVLTIEHKIDLKELMAKYKKKAGN